MAAPQQRLGHRAELATASWLMDKGWRVLEHRWRSPSGEIDLVCRDPDGILVAVEVKLRRTGRAGLPEDALDGRRMARLRAALAGYAMTQRAKAAGLRIDLVSVTPVGEMWRLSRWPGIDAW
jgi:putative endonuclease